MSFRLKEAVFKVRCREPGCPFNAEFTVKENIMGATETDVDSEALKIAKNLGFIKHDAVYGRNHQLQAPDVAKVSATYDRIGAPPAPALTPQPAVPAAPAVPTRTFRKGDVIVKRGDSAATVCEVIRGFALNEKLPDLTYKAGSTFGAAAIFRQKNRMVDIVAGEDGTTIAFYSIKDLARTNPSKARQLYDEAMEDVFHVLGYLESYAAGLERKIQRLEAASKKSAKPAKAARSARPARKAPKKPPAKKTAKKKVSVGARRR